MRKDELMYDVIVIGGSYAGLAATLQLARARKRVLILDAGRRRNRFAHHSHGFLGQDGVAPEAIAARGRQEVLAYPTVTWREAAATEARVIPGGFAVRAGDEEHQAKRLILATGVVDELPEIPGLAQRWGTQAFFCPYCDGYEFHLGRLGVLASGAAPVHFASLISEWAGPGQTTLFLNGFFEPTPEDLEQLASRGIQIEREPVAAIGGVAPVMEIQLRDGRQHAVDGLFLVTRTHLPGRFVESLGLATEPGMLGPMYKTDPMKETSVPGVYACGDAAVPVPSVSYAVADGVRAGAAAHQSLIFRH